MSLNLPSGFRKLPIRERRSTLAAWATLPEETEADLEQVERLIENAVGWHRLPLGLVPNLRVNGRVYVVPLVTEEPSVVAAASYAAGLVGLHGGLEASAQPGLIEGQIFLEGAESDRWPACREVLQATAEEALASMRRRGGGLRGLRFEILPTSGLGLLTVLADVRDALGANALNTALEALAPVAERELGGRKLMAILTNDSPERLARSRFRLPISALGRAGYSGAEMARRLTMAWAAAEDSSARAVTHNKGIMNGITALALATGNDTRALEAAVHRWAARDGRYRPLSRYRVEATHLVGEIELPLPLATVGGSTQSLPNSQAVWKLLGVSGAGELMEVAAALGLVQNLAALLALVGEGIQSGHMRLHRRREA